MTHVFIYFNFFISHWLLEKQIYYDINIFISLFLYVYEYVYLYLYEFIALQGHPQSQMWKSIKGLPPGGDPKDLVEGEELNTMSNLGLYQETERSMLGD